MEECNCENIRHFSVEVDSRWPELARDGHPYLGVEAGENTIMFLGPICDDCNSKCRGK